MEKGSTGSTEKTQSAFPCKDKSDEDSRGPNSHNSREATCGATAGRARWTLLRQVLCQKQTDSPEVKQVSVRRFASFDLFRRKKRSAQEHCDTSDDQWVEYRSVYYPEYVTNTFLVCWVLFFIFLHGYIGGLFFCSVLFNFSVSFLSLPGSQVAISADVKEVLLSDGNEKSIQNVQRVVESNRRAGKFGSTHVSSRVLRWDCEVDISALEGHFDTVMCADWYVYTHTHTHPHTQIYLRMCPLLTLYHFLHDGPCVSPPSPPPVPGPSPDSATHTHIHTHAPMPARIHFTPNCLVFMLSVPANG
uniref:Calmodulin-lysine N-methyltransferase n=1 Tax=Xiphophorus couchianus TaxID=32473 RepID=A0A3B5MDE8_9TELE